MAQHAANQNDTNEATQSELFTPAAAEAAPTTADTQKADVPKTYTVKMGDTLRSIGAQFGVSPAHLQDINDIEDANLLKVDQELKLKK